MGFEPSWEHRKAARGETFGCHDRPIDMVGTQVATLHLPSHKAFAISLAQKAVRVSFSDVLDGTYTLSVGIATTIAFGGCSFCVLRTTGLVLFCNAVTVLPQPFSSIRFFMD